MTLMVSWADSSINELGFLKGSLLLLHLWSRNQVYVKVLKTGLVIELVEALVQVSLVRSQLNHG